MRPRWKQTLPEVQDSSRAAFLEASLPERSHPERAALKRLARVMGNRGFARMLATMHDRDGIATDGPVHPDVETMVAASQGGGRLLRHVSERVDGHSLADTRGHADNRAVALTRAVSARAFKAGSDISVAPRRIQQHRAPASGAPIVLQQGNVLQREAEPLHRPFGLVVERGAGDAALSKPAESLILQRQEYGGECHCGGKCTDPGEQALLHRWPWGSVFPSSPPGENAPARPVKPQHPNCLGGRWKYVYDGCSVPAQAVGVLRGQEGSFDKDNPAGGRDTEFAIGQPTTRGGRACDRHDECYQTCESDQADCDARMFQDMMEICRRSRENRLVRARCYEWAHLYYKALRAFGEGPFKERKQQVCACDKKTLAPALTYPPLELLRQRNGGYISWLDYLLRNLSPPLSAYRAFLSAEEFDAYVKGRGSTETRSKLSMRNPAKL